MCFLFIDKNTVCKYLTNLCICIQCSKYAISTKDCPYGVFLFFLNITAASFDIASLTVDNLSKSTEGENQGILIDDGKKEK